MGKACTTAIHDTGKTSMAARCRNHPFHRQATNDSNMVTWCSGASVQYHHNLGCRCHQCQGPTLRNHICLAPLYCCLVGSRLWKRSGVIGAWLLKAADVPLPWLTRSLLKRLFGLPPYYLHNLTLHPFTSIRRLHDRKSHFLTPIYHLRRTAHLNIIGEPPIGLPMRPVHRCIPLQSDVPSESLSTSETLQPHCLASSSRYRQDNRLHGSTVPWRWRMQWPTR